MIGGGMWFRENYLVSEKEVILLLTDINVTRDVNKTKNNYEIIYRTSPWLDLLLGIDYYFFDCIPFPLQTV